MHRVIVNDYLDAILAGCAVAIVLTMMVYAVMTIRKALSAPQGTAVEVGGASGAVMGS